MYCMSIGEDTVRGKDTHEGINGGNMQAARCDEDMSSGLSARKYVLERNDNMSFARDRVCFLPVSGKVLVTPKDLWLSGANWK